MELDNELLQFIGVSVLSLLNFALLVWQTVKRVPREVDKMKAEKIESLTEAAESNMQGAQISNDLLVERIRELKKEKAEAWNHVAKLERQLIELKQVPVKFEPFDTDPKIEAVKKG